MLGVLYAAFARPDILHIHAIGPAIVTPIARLFGLKVVVTNHGPDYDRDKWGPFARYVLRVGERVGMKYSNARIVISQVIGDLVRTNYGRDSELIPNGVSIHEPRTDTDHLARFGLRPGRYFLHVGRMVPEKRQLDLIEAYRSILPNDWQLAIAGRLTDEPYSVSRARGRPRGRGRADRIPERCRAGAALLACRGVRTAVLARGTADRNARGAELRPARASQRHSRQPGGGAGTDDYFPLGDIPALARALHLSASSRRTRMPAAKRRRWVADRYDWNRIAEQTYALYETTITGPEMKPTFIGLGGQKCASSWLYTVFNDHPDAFVSTPKELNYFSAVYDRGHQWYESHFTGGAGRAAVGEISPSYLPDRDAPSRARAVQPRVSHPRCVARSGGTRLLQSPARHQAGLLPGHPIFPSKPGSPTIRCTSSSRATQNTCVRGSNTFRGNAC